jgi:hypothetical protein
MTKGKGKKRRNHMPEEEKRGEVYMWKGKEEREVCCLRTVYKRSRAMHRRCRQCRQCQENRQLRHKKQGLRKAKRNPDAPRQEKKEKSAMSTQRKIRMPRLRGVERFSAKRIGEGIRASTHTHIYRHILQIHRF